MSGALRGRFAQGLPISSEVGQREHRPAHLFDKVAVRIESYLQEDNSDDSIRGEYLSCDLPDLTSVAVAFDPHCSYHARVPAARQSGGSQLRRTDRCGVRREKEPQ